jgi:hypothetical protein
MPSGRADLAIVGGGSRAVPVAPTRGADDRRTRPVVRVPRRQRSRAARCDGRRRGFRVERAASSIRGASLDLLAAIRGSGSPTSWSPQRH